MEKKMKTSAILIASATIIGAATGLVLERLGVNNDQNEQKIIAKHDVQVCMNGADYKITVDGDSYMDMSPRVDFFEGECSDPKRGETYGIRLFERAKQINFCQHNPIECDGEVQPENISEHADFSWNLFQLAPIYTSLKDADQKNSHP